MNPTKPSIYHNIKLYLILANISIIFLFYSFWQIKPVLTDVDDFLGLTSHLTIFYWLGLMLITLCSVLIYVYGHDKNNYAFILLLIYLSIFLFGIPIFAEDNAWNPYSYYPAGEVKNVLTSGYVNTTSEISLMTYRSWPAVHMISAFILTITNVQFESLIKYMPIFWLLSMIFLIFSVGRRFKFSSNISFAAVFLFLASFWVPQYYYGGQSLAIIAFVSLFLLTISKGKASEIMGVLFYSMLAITHFLTSLIYLVQTSIQLKLKYYSKELAILLFVICSGWLIYFAPYAFTSGVDELVQQGASGNPFYWTHKQTFAPVTYMRTLINDFRLYYLLIYAIFMSLALLFYFAGGIGKDNKAKIKRLLPWIIGMAPLVVLQYGQEIFERLYIFSLVPAIFMIMSGINNKKIIPIIMILVIIPHIPAHYGDEISWQSSTVELKGSEFFAAKYPFDNASARHKAYYGGEQPYIWFSKPDMILLPLFLLSIFDIPEGDTNTAVASMLNNASYVLDDKMMRDRFRYYYGFDPIHTWIVNSKYDLIYNSNGYSIIKTL